ncbi:MAG TPA: transcriptional regulator [Streptosporangiaceae bacterium]|jgi:hypothetical protein
MYDRDVRQRAVALLEQGLSLRSISLSTGISRSALRDWRDHPEKVDRVSSCPRCRDIPTLPEPTGDYAYVLGLCLGDGCISVGGDGSRGVWILLIACADAWPGLLEECKRAVGAIRPDNKVGAVQRQGCAEVTCYSKHWPCLFPQHGPGKKQDREIRLEAWQRIITTKHPDSFARGLIHSDGSRFTNRVRRPLADGDHWYEYPRYMFTNESRDILALCGEALDQLGVSWKFSRPNTISVARRDAVARLDEFVGPKY